MKKHHNNEHPEDINMDKADKSNNPFCADSEQECAAEDTANNCNNELQAKYDNLHNQYVRLAADFDNYRKRQAQEKEAWLKYGMEETLTKMLEVLDNFDRANKSCENVNDVATTKECFGILGKQVKETLQKLGLKEIQTENTEFDPNFHEAVMQTPTSEYKEHMIINELQKGYQYGDKVLRPALVNVATSE